MCHYDADLGPENGGTRRPRWFRDEVDGNRAVSASRGALIRLLSFPYLFLLGLQLAAPVSHNATCDQPRFVSSIGALWPDMRTSISCFPGEVCEIAVYSRLASAFPRREIAIVTGRNASGPFSPKNILRYDGMPWFCSPLSVFSQCIVVFLRFGARVCVCGIRDIPHISYLILHLLLSLVEFYQKPVNRRLLHKSHVYSA